MLLLQSVSAFAPICNPTQCPWGDKAFKGYLGEEKSAWEEYDATLLVKKYNGPKTTILIDQVSCIQSIIHNNLSMQYDPSTPTISKIRTVGACY